MPARSSGGHYNLPIGRQLLCNFTGSYVKTRLNSDFHLQGFMRQEKMNLKFLLITWINYDPEMSGEDTRQEGGLKMCN